MASTIAQTAHKYVSWCFLIGGCLSQLMDVWLEKWMNCFMDVIDDFHAYNDTRLQ